MLPRRQPRPGTLLALLLTNLASLAAQGASANAPLLSQFNWPGFTYNDVWGYADPNSGKEYALLGATAGTFVIDCTDPSNPIPRAYFAAALSGWQDSTWRAIRTYRNYAYVVTEGGGGMQILDLSNPDQPRFVKTWGLTTWTNAHNLSCDPRAGRLYPCGTNAGVVMLDVSQDPENPVLLGTYTQAYVHDLQVQDGLAHLAEPGSNRYRIADFQTPPSTPVLGNAPVLSCHNVWPALDNRHAVTTTEAQDGGITVFSIVNPQVPVQLATWRTGAAGTSVHNAYLRDYVCHSSYYSEGYQGVDLSDPANPVRVAYYDTSAAVSSFSGAWGCYPFQPSGVIYVSDITNGLHVIGSKAAARWYGNGTAPAGATSPTIRAYGSAWVGNARYRLELAGAPAGAAVALVIGGRPANLNASGLTVLVDPSLPTVVLSARADASGQAAVALPVANQPGLVGGTIYAQFFVNDPRGPLGLTTSRGAAVEVINQVP